MCVEGRGQLLRISSLPPTTGSRKQLMSGLQNVVSDSELSSQPLDFFQRIKQTSKPRSKVPEHFKINTSTGNTKSDFGSGRDHF